jgi:hypothetical protein
MQVVLPPPARSSAGPGAYGSGGARTSRLRPGDLRQTRARMRRLAWRGDDNTPWRTGGACCARAEGGRLCAALRRTSSLAAWAGAGTSSIAGGSAMPGR